MLKLSFRNAGVLAMLAAWCMASCAQKPPGWFGDPPKDTAEFWFGVGEGADPEAARRGALVQVASRLRTTVSAEQRNRTTVRSDGKKEQLEIQADSTTSAKILETEFTKVDVETSAKTNVGYAVLIKVDRGAFMRDTRAQLEVVNKPVAEVEAALGGASTLEQYLALRRVASQVDKAINLSLLLIGAGAETEGSAGFTRYSALKQRREQVSSKLVFELRAKPEDADIVKAVAGALADQNIRSSPNKTAGASVLTVDTQTRQDEFDGSKLMRLNIRFSVMDEQGRAVASKEHVVSGGSRYDFRGARENAVGKLVQSLKQSNSLAALGFPQ